MLSGRPVMNVTEQKWPTNLHKVSGEAVQSDSKTTNIEGQIYVTIHKASFLVLGERRFMSWRGKNAHLEHKDAHDVQIFSEYFEG